MMLQANLHHRKFLKLYGGIIIVAVVVICTGITFIFVWWNWSGIWSNILQSSSLPSIILLNFMVYLLLVNNLPGNGQTHVSTLRIQMDVNLTLLHHPQVTIVLQHTKSRGWLPHLLFVYFLWQLKLRLQHRQPDQPEQSYAMNSPRPCPLCVCNTLCQSSNSSHGISDRGKKYSSSSKLLNGSSFHQLTLVIGYLIHVYNAFQSVLPPPSFTNMSILPLP